ncbi:MAG TPA: TrmH family RNA methyltransferase [Candidatus Saccharimonadales bacterium]|nr:TrmH family RNA methyltransferase [Candidatus Saccharimonadales bacterium]
MQKIILIVHNVRSAHNAGSILRSADGFGVEHVYFTGYTPYPQAPDDSRLPHIARRASNRISKTSLGAEKNISWSHAKNILDLISRLKSEGWLVAALEQTGKATDLPYFPAYKPVALIVGSETEGIDNIVLESADKHLQIPMLGGKESFNVSVAAAVALYHLRWYNQTPDGRKNKNGFAKIQPSPAPQTKRGKR